MSSGASNLHFGSFEGAAGDVDIETLPFKPRTMKFWRVNGGTIEYGFKHEDMSGSAYYSTTTGTDAGVTFNSNGTVTIANGADINAAGIVTYYEAVD